MPSVYVLMSKYAYARMGVLNRLQIFVCEPQISLREFMGRLRVSRQAK